ncbi:hypothetical protein J7U46_13350 [Pelomonas sp. V22]|uniref:hypothetical protein n=1 Tax=Pelomonas sp. V22 TaxID=2822139 RepID=UPI0024A8C314|nr:hypothetical protein [Pelomonas sp. V22]MDI4634038.1 hypothetical protein [Pelomonas sp. V22]
MKKRFGPSLYFATDKVIFDAMNHSKVTVDQVRELLFERNIIVSSKTSKDELTQYFSRLTADYFDHKRIGDKLGKISKRERVTYTEITNGISKDEIINGLKAVKEKLEEQGSSVDIDVKGNNIIATIAYDHIDYTEVEFRQVQPRDAVIEFLPDGSGGYIIRNTQNKFVDIAVDQTFAAINSEREEKIGSHRITLTGHTDPERRIKFFNSLINGIEDHQLITVTEAYCYKPQAGAISEDDEEKDLEEQSFVERISLKGKGVTKSFVISDLYDKGYYIVKVVWHAKPTSSMDADHYELEAQFSEPRDCTDFSYQVRCVVVCEEGKPTNKKRTPKSDEQDAIFRLIEAAAKKALTALEA